MEYGAGMSQDDFMRQDECLLLNYNDEVIGSDNKYNVHKFVSGQPKGVVHRAFSVMLFDGDGRLLLQQRAQCKVTFPKVWTNTCCSHPLHGQTPNEIDPPRTSTSAEPDGIKHAAVRKLKHELGIEPADLKSASSKYMGRVHYWAADTLTHGPNAPWGEHEIDYLLLYQLPKGYTLPLRPNPEEVMESAWVSAEELKARMAQEGLLWSPWFRVIASELLYDWWADLDAAFKRPAELSIRRFDAPAVHCKAGGAHSGAAATELSDLYKLEQSHEWESAARRKLTLDAEREARRRDLTSASRSASSAAANKQGGYGKVPTHEHSKKAQLARPLEVAAGLRLKFGSMALLSNLDLSTADEALRFCDLKLGEVSRSFAAVIRQLPKALVLDILVFYLVLRALDTIEDDMDAFKGREVDKCAHLRAFGDKYLGDEAWSMDGVGQGAERELLQNFCAVSRVFNGLPGSSKEVIRDITTKMGAGMADNVSIDMGQGTADLAAYAWYCHAVAGLVGEGLTQIFVGRGFETAALCGQGEQVWPFCKPAEENGGRSLGLANSMGLFLQKTNIIRDYLEDYADGRAFWPQQVWRQFARSSELGELARPTAHGAGSDGYPTAFDAQNDPDGAAVVGKGVNKQALSCLNFLIADALELVPDVLTYLELLRTPEVFRFSAIPQVMAIGTLAECFDNPRVRLTRPEPSHVRALGKRGCPLARIVHKSQ